MPLRDAVVGDVAPALRLLLGAAGLVLLVGCASVANLLLVRAVARRREFAIRVALGASRGRLAGQVLTESALVAIAGGIAGLALAAFMAPALRTLSFARFDDIRVDAGVLAFTIVAAALTALLSGIGPALLIVRTNVAPALASSSGRLGGGPRRAVDAALVVIQLALAVVLVSGAVLLASSLRNLASADPGFRAEGVFTARVTLPWPRYRGGGDYRRFERELVEQIHQSTIMRPRGDGTKH